MSLKKEKLNSDLNLEKIKKILGRERFQHTLSVLKAALKIAEIQNLNLKKVETAALLHDIAKSKSYTELIDIVKNSKWEPDQLELEIAPVLHAPAGAVMAEDFFGITDSKILEAIRFHTLGHPQMGEIAQVIYAADFISEDREIDGLDEIRIEIERDFESGLYSITTHILKYQLEQNNFIHPYSNDFRNKLLKRSD
ncbi:putative HD superfamily hydrolase involved in NAD metabolism [Halanaerobium saccharolyticum]|uniref:bis(5'-nucleosyl)-tetraphosphatase (symmetrical) n=1 Tax=Halanaerobium saccharolyticum TaxID=43595 RepID=A0A4R7ZA84_9FIRM|nr:bis(5'-nucleosyl)-tetraphosphatase (symmetrical) YqeK [Halanaerobium saccharolyticum]RAK10311.1 putative HD superfamily hydrolase involved in NAD metabolism [Halanaerobium saccharolyticum]TDW05257.1 putative HD superfamily hydrolase involved in NAD metabolism [Halanaerobium saccharolyticum]TDX60327.1 putative HD superfamily hydrolase involved in NAD metabolism [Halanaerobium saccharolyticum]